MDKNTTIVAVAGIAAAVILVLAILLIQPSTAPPITLQTCSEQGGSVCPTEETCTGTWVSASDTTRCCSGTCNTVTPPIVPPTGDGKTCAQQMGSFCTTAQSCPGVWLEASDTDRCCSMSCLVQDGGGGTTIIYAGGEQALQNPFLWKIHGNPDSYLYGTIHIPDDRVLTFPQVLGDALEGADVFYAEILLDAATQNTIAAAGQLPPGQTLSTVLPADLYQRSSDFVGTRGYSMMMFESFKVWAFASLLEQLDYLQDSLTKKPPDMYLYAAAEAMGKELGGIETAQEQMDIFESLTLDEQIEFLEVALEIQETYRKENRDSTQESLEAYIAGDINEFLAMQEEELSVESDVLDALLKVLGPDRNVRMADRIDAALKAKPGKSIFFAFGVAHFIGDGSVVDLLQDKGYTVTRVVPSTPEEGLAWDLPPTVEQAFESAWCPAGLETEYSIQGMGVIPVKIYGLEFYKGRQMCHIEASFDIGYGELTPINIYIDKDGKYEIDLADIPGADVFGGGGGLF